MKMNHQTQNLLFWINYILVILYISQLFCNSKQLSIQDMVLLLIVSLMMIDITYIGACNIRENKVVSLFCGLLILDGWYVLLLTDTSAIVQFAFAALSPVIWCASVLFILMFLFQGSGYKFRKTINGVLFAVCVAALISIGISDRVYALLYGIQLLTSWSCLLIVIISHWNRAVYVLKCEWKCIAVSAVITVLGCAIYYFTTIEIPYHMSNFGIYIPILLFGMSVHGIVIREHNSSPLSTIFNRRQSMFIIVVSLLVIASIVQLAEGTLSELCIAVNMLFAFIYLCNIILGQSVKEGKSTVFEESKYYTTLLQLQKEEELKKDFANFLHDDILQDILSIKNMITKAYRPDIQDIIVETLRNLDGNIREQMHNYHPVILKKLTIKENYQNLINAVSQSFPQRNIEVSFDCSDALFVVAPYDILIYRMIKELLTNIYKHSDGSRAWIMLALENGAINLCVADDGTAYAASLLLADKIKHKGIASIAEQVKDMNGTVDISDNAPHGIRIQISIPMKGDVSYQYFIS